MVSAPGAAEAVSYHVVRKGTEITPPLGAESRQALSRSLG